MFADHFEKAIGTGFVVAGIVMALFFMELMRMNGKLNPLEIGIVLFLLALLMGGALIGVGRAI